MQLEMVICSCTVNAQCAIHRYQLYETVYRVYTFIPYFKLPLNLCFKRVIHSKKTPVMVFYSVGANA